MLTQKDFYDFISKNGVDAYNQMMTELADNANKAKAEYDAAQKKKEEKNALVAGRVNTLTDLFTDWFDDDVFKVLSPAQMAKTVYTAVENFNAVGDKLMKHAKNVKTETKEIPGGTETVTTAEIDEKDFDKAVKDVLKDFDKFFLKW